MYPTYSLMSGFGYRMVYNSSILVVLQYFIRWRSLAVGIITSSTAIGMFAVTQITQVLLSAFGWRGTLRGFALLYCLCGLCSTVFVPLDKQEEKRTDDNSAAKAKEMEARNPLPLFKNRSFIIFSASLIILNVGYFVPTVHIVSMNVFHARFVSILKTTAVPQCAGKPLPYTESPFSFPQIGLFYFALLLIFKRLCSGTQI